MTRMRAAVAQDDGSFELVTVDRPEPLATEVVIEVAAAGVNPVDWKTIDGAGARAAASADEPLIVGWDVAGTIVEAGPGVTRFEVGDRVFGMPRFPRPANAYAEYVVAGSREIARTPDALSDVEAGALPLAGLTAWQAVVDTLRVGAGDRLLIHAASGGVGHLAVQIAKARGAEVWASASGSNHDLLRDLGADHLIDYRNERFEDVASDMDAVLDLYGQHANPTRSLATMRRGGRLALIPAPDQLPSPDALEAAAVTATWMLVEPDYAALEALAAMATAGALRVVVAETRPLAAVGELHEIGRRGGPPGKLVATIG